MTMNSDTHTTFDDLDRRKILDAARNGDYWLVNNFAIRAAKNQIRVKRRFAHIPGCDADFSDIVRLVDLPPADVLKRTLLRELTLVKDEAPCEYCGGEEEVEAVTHQGSLLIDCPFCEYAGTDWAVRLTTNLVGEIQRIDQIYDGDPRVAIPEVASLVQCSIL